MPKDISIFLIGLFKYLSQFSNFFLMLHNNDIMLHYPMIVKKCAAYTLLTLILLQTASLSSFAKRPHPDPQIRLQHCIKETYAYDKIACMYPIDTLKYAYGALYPERAYHKIILAEHGIYYLRLQALKNTKHYNEEIIATLEQLGIHNPPFVASFRGAIEWAEQERIKPPEELYQASKNIPSDITDQNLREYLRYEYLELATKNGHIQAKTEKQTIDAQSDAYVKKIAQDMQTEKRMKSIQNK